MTNNNCNTITNPFSPLIYDNTDAIATNMNNNVDTTPSSIERMPPPPTRVPQSVLSSSHTPSSNNNNKVSTTMSKYERQETVRAGNHSSNDNININNDFQSLDIRNNTNDCDDTPSLDYSLSSLGSNTNNNNHHKI